MLEMNSQHTTAFSCLLWWSHQFPGCVWWHSHALLTFPRKLYLHLCKLNDSVPWSIFYSICIIKRCFSFLFCTSITDRAQLSGWCDSQQHKFLEYELETVLPRVNSSSSFWNVPTYPFRPFSDKFELNFGHVNILQSKVCNVSRLLHLSVQHCSPDSSHWFISNCRHVNC